jgi:hypothetical protein
MVALSDGYFGNVKVTSLLVAEKPRNETAEGDYGE